MQIHEYIRHFSSKVAPTGVAGSIHLVPYKDTQHGPPHECSGRFRRFGIQTSRKWTKFNMNLVKMDQNFDASPAVTTGMPQDPYFVPKHCDTDRNGQATGMDMFGVRCWGTYGSTILFIATENRSEVESSEGEPPGRTSHPTVCAAFRLVSTLCSSAAASWDASWPHNCIPLPNCDRRLGNPNRGDQRSPRKGIAAGSPATWKFLV